jgi:hypothetical protein
LLEQQLVHAPIPPPRPLAGDLPHPRPQPAVVAGNQGARRCVERCCPTQRYARRSETPGLLQSKSARYDVASPGARGWSPTARAAKTRSRRAAPQRQGAPADDRSVPVAGRQSLSAQVLAADERVTINAALRQLDFLSEETATIERALATFVLQSPSRLGCR